MTAPAAGTPVTHAATQLFEASTLYGLVTLVAALDQGVFGPHEGRRVLVCTNNATVPEAVAGLTDSPSFARLASAFDDVVSYNDAISPLHPSAWRPTPAEQPLWERYFRLVWGLGTGPVDLVVESIHVSPAQALAWSFPQAAIDVYADGLMTYGPTRDKILSEVGARIRRLVHLDLVPGLVPLYLTEFGVEHVLIATDRFRRVLAGLAADAPLRATSDAYALLLGQYLSPLGLVSTADEERLHVDLLEAAYARGHRRVVFKPHPTAPADLAAPMLARAAELGVAVEVFAEPVLAEALYERTPVALVVGCFSTGLATAGFWGIDAVAVGTGAVLGRLRPYQNSNRVPLVLADSLVAGPDGPARLTVDETGELVQAVGFVMQPEILADRRRAVAAWLERHGRQESRFFPDLRLGELGLPGGRTTVRTRLAPTLRRAARSAYAVERRLEARFMGPIRGA